MVVKTVTKSQLNYLVTAHSESEEVSDTTYNSPFLRLLVSADRKHLTQSFTEHTCVPGEILFREGEQGDTMYLIWSGQVAVIKGDLHSPTILGYRGAGEIIGEMALLENRPRSASVIALDHLRLLCINRQKFQQLLHDTPSVSMNIMEILSSRLRESDDVRSEGELSEKRLIRQVSALQSEKQRLEELQRLRQETSDLIIHDLRNPLSSISVAIKMFSLDLSEEVLQTSKELLEIAERGCERMQRLVDSLLDVSRMESGEEQFVMSEVDLKALIEDVVRRQTLLFERMNIDLQVRVSEKLPLILADRDKIERVLTNLMDNALKNTFEGGRAAVAAEELGEFVEISVTDNGLGVPEDQRERIFERFTQVAGEKRQRRGFGLGLSYCRLAVEAHGGRIWVEPGEGGTGSRFVFTLPLKPSE